MLVMWYVGGKGSPRPALSMHMSLTKSGLPRIIPPLYRKMIRRGDDLRVVKTVLSGLLPHHTGRRKVLDEN